MIPVVTKKRENLFLKEKGPFVSQYIKQPTLFQTIHKQVSIHQ